MLDTNFECIRDIATHFEGRLGQEWVDDVLSYVEYNEPALAIEMLCSYLLEEQTAVTKSEFDKLLECASLFQADHDRVTDLREQVE